jgi:hypothetical protein
MRYALAQLGIDVQALFQKALDAKHALEKWLKLYLQEDPQKIHKGPLDQDILCEKDSISSGATDLR